MRDDTEQNIMITHLFYSPFVPHTNQMFNGRHLYTW